MEAEAVDQLPEEEHGVMVISAWASADPRRLVARVTMTQRPAEPSESEVRVVSSKEDLHALVDDWLARLRP